MTQIEPYPLWLGHAGEGRDLQQIFDLGIKAVVDLALEETPTSTPRELIAARFPILDGAGNRGEVLFLAVSTVATLLKLHVPVLVTCGGGVSRAPAVAAAALALLDGNTPEACLKLVAKHHHSDVSPGLWNEVVGVLPGRRSAAAASEQ